MAVILAVNMLVIGIFGSYQTAQATALAGFGAAEVLESILLGFGISIFTADTIKNGTSAAWWDTDGSAALKPYYDDLEQAYEEQRFKVINGGGGQDPQPSPTPAPGNTPIPFPTTAPVPGDIPTFKELVAPALAGTAAVINMTQGAWECMSKAVSSLWDGLMDNTPPTSDLKGNPFSESSTLIGKVVGTRLNSRYGLITDTQYLYSIRNPVPSDMGFKGTITEGSKGLNKFDLSICSYPSWGFNSNNYRIKYYCLSVSSVGKSDSLIGSTSSPPVDQSMYADIESVSYSYEFYVPYIINGVSHSADIRPDDKEVIWVHPDLQDTYKNNGKLEYPQQAPRP